VDISAFPNNRAGRELIYIYREVLRAVTAEALVRKTVRLEGHTLHIQNLALDLSSFCGIHVLGAGKASAAMAQALEAILDGRLTSGIVVTKYGHAEPTERVRVLEAGHPVPDAASLVAGQALAEAAEALGDGDLALVVLSGGASALMELPAEGVSLEDLQATTDALLRCGATINELNAVRSRISRIKAGGLARLLAPARIVCLVMSDVLGNPLDVIGSGPCWIGAEGSEDPMSVLDRYGLADSLPRSVVRHVGESPLQAASAADVTHVIIGDVHSATTAAADAARGLGHGPLVLTESMRGEAREIGWFLGGVAHDLAATARECGTDCVIIGGETTVTVRGDGLGGRCQELACAASTYMSGAPDVALLAAGTDGTDGPTDAAGALVDGLTVANAREAGHTVEDSLAQSDTYRFLDAAGALVRTGPTGSNVNDVVLLLYAPGA